LLVALLVVLVVLVAKNTHSVKLDWAVGSTHASLAWIILAAAVLGWLVGIATSVAFRKTARVAASDYAASGTARARPELDCHARGE
jgi:uncharacterized integral membrane protein